MFEEEEISKMIQFHHDLLNKQIQSVTEMKRRMLSNDNILVLIDHVLLLSSHMALVTNILTVMCHDQNNGFKKTHELLQLIDSRLS